MAEDPKKQEEDDDDDDEDLFGQDDDDDGEIVEPTVEQPAQPIKQEEVDTDDDEEDLFGQDEDLFGQDEPDEETAVKVAVKLEPGSTNGSSNESAKIKTEEGIKAEDPPPEQPPMFELDTTPSEVPTSSPVPRKRASSTSSQDSATTDARKSAPSETAPSGLASSSLSTNGSSNTKSPVLKASSFGLSDEVIIPATLSSDLLTGRILDALKHLPVNLINDALQEYDDAITQKKDIRSHGAYLFGVLKRYLSVHERASGAGNMIMGKELTPQVQAKLQQIVRDGFVTQEELNDKVTLKVLMLSEKDALLAIEEFSGVDRGSIRNVGSYFMGILNRYMRGERNPNDRRGSDVPERDDRAKHDRGRNSDRGYNDRPRFGDSRNNDYSRDRSRDRYDSYRNNSDRSNYDRQQQQPSQYERQQQQPMPPPPPPPKPHRPQYGQQPPHQHQQQPHQQPVMYQPPHQQVQQPGMYQPPQQVQQPAMYQPPQQAHQPVAYQPPQQAQQPAIYQPPQLPNALPHRGFQQGVPPMSSNIQHQPPAPNQFVQPPIVAQQPYVPAQIPQPQHVAAPVMNTVGVPNQMAHIQNRAMAAVRPGFGSVPNAPAPNPPVSSWQQQQQQRPGGAPDILGIAAKAAQALAASQHLLQPHSHQPPVIQQPVVRQQQYQAPQAHQQQPHQPQYQAHQPQQQYQAPQAQQQYQAPAQQYQQQPPPPQHYQQHQQVPAQQYPPPVRRGKTVAKMHELPIAVQFAVQNLQTIGHIRGPLDEGILGMIRDLPEPMALDTIQRFVTLDTSNMRNTTAYFAGVLRRELEKINRR